MDAMAAHVMLQRTSSSLFRGEEKVLAKTGSVQIKSWKTGKLLEGSRLALRAPQEITSRQDLLTSDKKWLLHTRSSVSCARIEIRIVCCLLHTRSSVLCT
jgi:hypothetical protein